MDCSTWRILFLVIAVAMIGCGGSLDESPYINPFGAAKGDGPGESLPFDTTAWVVGAGFVQVAENDRFGSPIVYDPQNAAAAPTLQLQVQINGVEGRLTTEAGYHHGFGATQGILLTGVSGTALRSQWQFELLAQQVGEPWRITNCVVMLSQTEIDEISKGNGLVRRGAAECGATVDEAELRRLERIEFNIYQDPTQQIAPEFTTLTPTPTIPTDPSTPSTPVGTTDPSTPVETADPSAPVQPAEPYAMPSSSGEAVGCGVANVPTPPSIILLLLVPLISRRRTRRKNLEAP